MKIFLLNSSFPFLVCVLIMLARVCLCSLCLSPSLSFSLCRFFRFFFSWLPVEQPRAHYVVHNHILKNGMNTLENIRNGIPLNFHPCQFFIALFFAMFIAYLHVKRTRTTEAYHFSSRHTHTHKHQHIHTYNRIWPIANGIASRFFFLLSLSFSSNKLIFSCAFLRYVDPLYCMKFPAFAVCLISMADAVTGSVVFVVFPSSQHWNSTCTFGSMMVVVTCGACVALHSEHFMQRHWKSGKLKRQYYYN